MTEYLYKKSNSNYHAIGWETLKIFPLRCRARRGNPSLLSSVVLKVLVSKAETRKRNDLRFRKEEANLPLFLPNVFV